MEYSNSSSYEEQLRKHVNKISEGSYDNIKDIIKYPNQISLKILRILIEYACLVQNIAPIELARKKIKEIDSSWLNNFIPQVAQMFQLTMRLEKQLKILRIRRNWLQNINWADYKILNVRLSNDNSNKIINSGHKLSYNTCYIMLIM